MEINYIIYTVHFLKKECRKCLHSTVVHFCRHLVKSSIMLCNTSWIASLILPLSSSKVAGHVSDKPTKDGRRMRNQEILVASLNHETVRLDHVETFCATSPYSIMQYVMWCHLAGTTLSHVFPTKLLCMLYAPMALETSPLLTVSRLCWTLYMCMSASDLIPVMLFSQQCVCTFVAFPYVLEHRVYLILLAYQWKMQITHSFPNFSVTFPLSDP
jgi:hypothetical protein